MKKRVDRLKLRNYLTIGKPPIGPNELDPGIFRYSEVGRDPVLLPGVHAQIVNDIEMFCGNQVQRIKKFVLVGDALKPGNKNRTCELKVLIVINKDLMDIDIDGLLAEDLIKMADAISGRLAVGTLHPIRYIPTVRDIREHDEYPGIYDILMHSWIKLPPGLKC
jgi:hypothetical protein